MSSDEVANTELYHNIISIYSNSIAANDFDNLLADIKGNMSKVLCLCLNDSKAAQDNLIAIKTQSPELGDRFDEAVQNIQNAAAAAQLRYDYFVENSTTMTEYYRKVPQQALTAVLPFMQQNLPEIAAAMSNMIFTMCGDVSSAISNAAHLLVVLH